MNNAIFISWESHQRTRRLCEKLDIPLHEIVIKGNPFVRYFLCAKKTLAIIYKHNPKTLIIQNPSIVLSFLCVILNFFKKYDLVVDAHNEAVHPYIHNGYLIKLVSRFIIRRAKYTIVTNQKLADDIVNFGGTPIVVPDFLPTVNKELADLPAPTTGPFILTLICTYAPDEPYMEAFKAAEMLGDKVLLNVTGKIPSDLQRDELSKNINLLGFVDEETYWKTLMDSHIVIDLTTMPNCLVCGAYEALSIGKPMILSKDEQAEKYFSNATLTENTAPKIVEAIEESTNWYVDYVARTKSHRETVISLETQTVITLRGSFS